MLGIRKKQEKGQLINYSEFCSINSYCGWLELYDGYVLKQKYIIPLVPSILKYYQDVILHNNGKSEKCKITSFERYKKKIIKEGVDESSMKDLGIRQGSGTQAKTVVYCGDTVYVHTDIKRVEKVGGEAVDDLYSYHEYQYGVEEYIETIGNENASMKQQLEEVSGETS